GIHATRHHQRGSPGTYCSERTNRNRVRRVCVNDVSTQPSRGLPEGEGSQRVAFETRGQLDQLQAGGGCPLRQFLPSPRNHHRAMPEPLERTRKPERLTLAPAPAAL